MDEADEADVRPFESLAKGRSGGREVGVLEAPSSAKTEAEWRGETLGVFTGVAPTLPKDDGESVLVVKARSGLDAV